MPVRQLSETKVELDAVAESHGWMLDGIAIIELSQLESAVTLKSQNTLFQPAEVELTNLSKLLLEEINKLRPQRVVARTGSGTFFAAEYFNGSQLKMLHVPLQAWRSYDRRRRRRRNGGLLYAGRDRAFAHTQQQAARAGCDFTEAPQGPA
jgi:hypothetical protein